MPIFAIANIFDRNKRVGLRLISTESKTIKDLQLDTVKELIQNNSIQVQNVGVSNGEVVGTNGSLDRLAKIVNGKLKGKSPLVVINQLGEIGYTVCDLEGRIAAMPNDKVIQYSKLNGIANGKVVQREDGTEFISSILGSYDIIESPETKKKPNKVVEAVQEKVAVPVLADQISKVNQEKNLDKDTHVPTPSRGLGKRFKDVRESKNLDSNVMGSNNKPLTVEQVVVKSIMSMKKTHPFYFGVYAGMKRNETLDIPTMAVSGKDMYYNPHFVQTLTEGELNFINLHEVCHVVMLHGVRRKHRHPYVFNIACDLIINAILCRDFGVKPGQTVTVNNCVITAPKDMCFAEDLDIKKETPESVYDKLMAEIDKQKMEELDKMKKPGQKKNDKKDKNEDCESEEGQEGDGEQDSQDGSDQSDDQNGQGDEEGDGEGDGSGQGDGEGDGDQEGNGSGQGDGEGDEEGDGEGDGSGKGKGKGSGKGKGKGSGDDEEDQESSGQGKGSDKYDSYDPDDFSSTTVTYEGREIQVTDKYGDVLAPRSKEEDAKIRTQTLDVIERAKVHAAGTGAGCVAYDLVIEMLCPVIKWHKLLNKDMLEITKLERSFSSPDRRFISRNIYLPGPKKTDPESIGGLKILIDTSGSMTGLELKEIWGQIDALLKRYKIFEKAEVIYWDDGVKGTGLFSDMKDFTNIPPSGGGGTQITPVFDYLVSKECEVKPRIVIVFTDGCFWDDIPAKYAKKFKHIIWVITDNKNWKEPFGKITHLRIRDI